MVVVRRLMRRITHYDRLFDLSWKQQQARKQTTFPPPSSVQISDEPRVSSHERIYKIRDSPWANLYKCSKSLSSEIFPRNFPRIISQFWKIPSSRELNKFGWHRRPRMQEEGERWWDLMGRAKEHPELFRYGRLFRSTSSHKARREWLTTVLANYELGICRFTENITTGTG